MPRKLSLRRALTLAAPGLAWLAPAAGATCASHGQATPAYRQRALETARRIGVAPGWAQAHQWHLQPSAASLVPAGRDVYARPLRLAPRAASALLTMVAAAARESVVLQPVSGFRSFGYQRRLLRRKLDRGTPLAAVLEVNALPGFSEHHSGCALDLTTPGVPAADAAFAGTPAFAWLVAHAGDYGFSLSYPPGNRQGIVFEPWHWRYQGRQPPALADALATATPAASERQSAPTPPTSGESPHVP
ncbi:MAG TPA: M15 family metallopeptidase [Frateuria sp.]|uniref:M15 family metallopeptidase n=1 Tax=Frateuria sp. TaxID=2211372 RepID=UPI002D7E53F8|nr:M15 family metallopeptidase [Frateuria sp.]HET6806418.1 M15 family metallopeptidase [Frateuria sp.]